MRRLSTFAYQFSDRIGSSLTSRCVIFGLLSLIIGLLQIETAQQLGKGNFGTVHSGYLKVCPGKMPAVPLPYPYRTLP